MDKMLSEFNLLVEPWVKVYTRDNEVKEVSLSDALLHAHEYVRLAGESTAQDAAMHRMMLALLYSVVNRYDLTGDTAQPMQSQEQAVSLWKNLWECGKFPEEMLKPYFTEWYDRFFLFDETHPFYQVHAASTGTLYTARKLNGTISESGNVPRWFRDKSIESDSLSYAEAARWLIYSIGYDDTAVKP